MEKRKFEKLNIETSLLGFGCMRFPTLENGEIDEFEAEKMLDEAIKNGVNYIDTAYPYHNGASEPFVGRVLDKYPRESYYLATKLPMWKVEKREDVTEIFNEQLKRLNKEYVDFYLLHSMNKASFEKTKALGVLDILEEYRKYGIGSKLVNELKTYCRSLGIQELKVTASYKNVNAINFYKKQGYHTRMLIDMKKL